MEDNVWLLEWIKEKRLGGWWRWWLWKCICWEWWVCRQLNDGGFAEREDDGGERGRGRYGREFVGLLVPDRDGGGGRLGYFYEREGEGGATVFSERGRYGAAGSCVREMRERADGCFCEREGNDRGGFYGEKGKGELLAFFPYGRGSTVARLGLGERERESGGTACHQSEMEGEEAARRLMREGMKRGRYSLERGDGEKEAVTGAE